MQYAIQIPKPCHEAWDGMTPESNGRHCAQCCKTVVDFSGWEDAAVLQYMQLQGGAEVCGRFRNEQLDKPMDADTFVSAIAYAPLPMYKKIAAIFLVAFGLLQLSFDAHAQQPAQKVPDTASYDKPMIMGKLMAPPHYKPHKVPKPPTPPKVKKTDPGGYTQGDIAVSPIPPSPPPPPPMPPQHIAGLVQVNPVHDTAKKKEDTKTKKR